MGKFPQVLKKADIPVQEAQKIANKMNPKRPTPRNIMSKMPKVKDQERILKAARKKQFVNYKTVSCNSPRLS